MKTRIQLLIKEFIKESDKYKIESKYLNFVIYKLHDKFEMLADFEKKKTVR